MKKFASLAAAGLMLAMAGSAFAEDAKDLLKLQTSQGPVTIELYDNVAPKNVARVKELAQEGAYNGVAFHRVIDGFMAQTGDVQYGNMDKDFDDARVGMGGSNQPDLPAEFSDIHYERGIVGMARAQDPNSANSQFFIMFADAPFLDNQYTVIGKVVDGMDNVDKIKKGSQADNGKVENPDRIVTATVESN
ncbi:peptidylprolyl isomerase [Martelella sp. HB161492]|uniref:peptidylprolyl isomerase n=1 Tax=Martelella sp. HB161492 TaxID=2720726 RepID=UPI0015912DEB|nr:peptidylprolyl isomerase [Martelella sp. HB161492]